jgi:glutaredoxin 3
VSKVEIYSSMWCPFCHRAKRLLQSKGVGFEEFDVDADPTLRHEMTTRSGGRRTVPQIFIDDLHVGGSDELAALEREGRLNGMLQPD